jgi:hypothetical protein
LAKCRTPKGSPKFPKNNGNNKTAKISPPSNNKRQPKRIGPEDPCPFHVGHNWGKCLDNTKNTHTPIAKKFFENSKPNVRAIKPTTRNSSPIIATVSLLKNNMIHLPKKTVSPAKETETPSVLS